MLALIGKLICVILIAVILVIYIPLIIMFVIGILLFVTVIFVIALCTGIPIEIKENDKIIGHIKYFKFIPKEKS